MRLNWQKPVRLVLLIACFLAGVDSVVVQAAPRRLAISRLEGTDYYVAKDFAARFGLKTKLSKSGRELSFKSAWTTIKLEADSRECELNGIRVFLGDPVKLSKGRFYLGRLDAEKRLTPLLLPGAGESRVPALKVIVIDAGHGGRDPGKENRRLKVNEKSLALDTAQKLKKVLETQGYRVVMTRSRDAHLAKTKKDDLRRRAEIANEVGADLFISLHYNAVGRRAQRVSGVEVYTLTPQNQFSTADSERDDKKGAKVKLIGNANDHWNTIIGYQVQRRMVTDLTVTDRGLKYARWSVLRHAECPAILVESGFLSNDAEAQRIMQSAYRQKIAIAIADAVQAYGNIVAGARRTRASK